MDFAEKFMWFLALIAIGNHVTLSETDSCHDIPRNKRIECGWPGISQAECESRGCCFDSRFRKSLWCFKRHGTTNHTADRGVQNKQTASIVRSCAVDPGDRIDCGWPRIKEEVCENRGCCYSEEYKNSFWCFHPKTSFTPSSVEKTMKCVAKCMRMPWRRTLLVGASCQTNVACWNLRGSLYGASCMILCKANSSVADFIGNLSSCLMLSEESQIESENRCNSDLKCWVQIHGWNAGICLEEYVRNLSGHTLKITPSDLGRTGQIARQPEIEMPPYRPNIPLEPNHEDPGRLPIPDRNITRTPIDVEKSVVPPVEDRTDEEDPNPWWELERARA